MDRWLEHLCDDDLALLERATGRRAGPGQIEALLADPAAYQAVFTPTTTRSCAPRRSSCSPSPCTRPPPTWRRPPTSGNGAAARDGSPSSTPPPCARSWPP